MAADSSFLKEPVVGTMIRVVQNPAIAHIAHQAGLDFIMADMEHGAYSFPQLERIGAAAEGTELKFFVRVPELTRGYISRALDCGVDGIMVPHLESVEQAENLVHWAKYGPVGARGFASSGGHTGYMSVDDIRSYMDRANAEILAIAQIETRKAVQNADKIAAVEGIDVLLVGPNDLSISLDTPGDLNSPAENEAIQRVIESAAAHNKTPGMHAGFDLLAKWIPHGLTFLMNQMDIGILKGGFQNLHDKITNDLLL